jgi:ferredoxin
MKILVDRSICSGHAMCALKGPNVYKLDEDGFNISDGQTVPPAFEEEARRGSAVCPEQAIRLTEGD